MRSPRAIGLTNQAEGALPNGTKIVKVNSEEGDGNKDGTKGVVIGSLYVHGQEDFGYYIHWEGAPMPVYVIGGKITKDDSPEPEPASEPEATPEPGDKLA